MEEIDEESLEFARKFKKKIRFDIGEIVYMKSDLKKKCPMIIIAFEVFYSDSDYICSWITSHKEMRQSAFLDKILMQ